MIGDGDARPCKAPGEALGGERAVLVVVAGDDQARDAGRRREGAEAAGGERRRGADFRHGSYEGQHRLDALRRRRAKRVRRRGRRRTGRCRTGRPRTGRHVRRSVRAPCASSGCPPWQAGAGRARCAGRRVPRRHCRSRRRPAPGTGAPTSLRDSEARDGSAVPGTGSVPARARADKPRHGCRRWRGTAATGGAPLRSRRSCRLRPSATQPPDRGPVPAPGSGSGPGGRARNARASSSAARSVGARSRDGG